MTVKLSLVSIIFGTIGGVALGAIAMVGSPGFAPLRQSMSTLPNYGHRGIERMMWGLRLLALAIIDAVRAVPLLLMILLCYYAFPAIFPGVDRASIFIPCATAFSINLAAFTGELVRAGVMALPPGAVVAARALGMTPWQTWWHIILPEIARDIFPAQMLLFITIIKMTTLASVVALYEILHAGDSIIQRTYRPLEIYVAIGAFFIILIVPLELIARKLEATNLFRRRGL